MKLNERLIITTARQSGRLTKAQKHALKTQSQFLIDDISKVSENTVIEIGFGNGGFLCQMALLHPKMNFIGIDVYLPGLGSALIKAANLELKNLKCL